MVREKTPPLGSTVQHRITKIHSRVYPHGTNNLQSHAWNVKYIFRDTKLEVSGDISSVAYLVPISGLVGLLESLNGTVNKGSVARRRHSTENLVASEFTIEGEEHLSDLDDPRRDSVVRLLTGLGEMPSSRRMGKFSCRFGSRSGQISRVGGVLTGSVVGDGCKLWLL